MDSSRSSQWVVPDRVPSGIFIPPGVPSDDSSRSPFGVPSGSQTENSSSRSLWEIPPGDASGAFFKEFSPEITSGSRLEISPGVSPLGVFPAEFLLEFPLLIFFSRSSLWRFVQKSLSEFLQEVCLGISQKVRLLLEFLLRIAPGILARNSSILSFLKK